MQLPTPSSLEAARSLLRGVLLPTPQIAWPLLSARLGCETWVKHENALPTGAFKVRGGLVLAERLAREGVRGVVAATRGNHGQSVAFAAQRFGLTATIYVPHGNSPSKNAAMRAFGATLALHGRDFQEALEEARRVAERDGLVFFPSFAPELVTGVASYALELFEGAGPLDAVYVPIGLGSGICGVIAAREALGLGTEVIGVVAEGAPAYALSFEAGRPVSTESADTFADGVACRVPVPEAVEILRKHAARVVRVTDAEIRAAMRALFDDTHHVAEGAGAAPLAAALQERGRNGGRRIALVLSGGNVDADVFRAVLA
ncbi:MAG: threonine dehydratase [Candidatus Limnocylindria bacterium]